VHLRRTQGAWVVKGQIEIPQPDVVKQMHH